MNVFKIMRLLIGAWGGGHGGWGGPEPDRAEPSFRAAGAGLGLDVNGPAGLGLKVCG